MGRTEPSKAVVSDFEGFRYSKSPAHDLRHTFASQLIEQGAHPKYIQEQLGHASITMTMDTYGHLFPNRNRAG